MLAPVAERIIEGLDTLAKEGKYPTGRAEYVKNELRNQIHNWFGLELSSQLVGEGQGEELKMTGLNNLLREVSQETQWMTEQKRAEYAAVPAMRAAISELSARTSHDALLAAVVNPAINELG